jgi:hypothetical protein
VVQNRVRLVIILSFDLLRWKYGQRFRLGLPLEGGIFLCWRPLLEPLMPFPHVGHAHVEDWEISKLLGILCIITGIMPNQILVVWISPFTEQV